MTARGHPTNLQTELDALRLATSSDFAAAAFAGGADRGIRWIGASGSVGERYRLLVEKESAADRGIAGWVVRHGRPFVVCGTESNAEGRRTKYPLLLAEKLTAIAAVPIRDGADVVGALLIGQRTERAYDPADTEMLEREAERRRLSAYAGGPVR
ncbi:GAF domain-containing protein [Paenibacillus flagellatus]|uniref:GAF domain-containing protein n=1 Tax=Paenibacillus flagellatus TaxID=2211139 RepID=A0A2V5KTJ1_9BACL|nr:GAF domain-containing protein [Paenibacillus flagellatus]PYI52536.1 hypothetical protein DLM86_20390 [Paenibacillus flagellatus]